MFVTVRNYKIKQGSAIDLARIAQSEFLVRIEQIPGFRAYYLVHGDDHTDRIASVGIFDSLEGVEQSDQIAAEFVSSRLEGARLSDVILFEGQVLVSSVSGAASVIT